METLDTIIGTRVRIDNSDNENFGQCLPRIGRVTQRLNTPSNTNSWYLVELEDPFDWQIKIADPFVFRGLYCDKIVIGSRWKNHHIGETEPTSVYTLLIPDKEILKQENIPLEKLYHVSWCMCHTEKSNT